jgi:hypothetical protein
MTMTASVALECWDVRMDALRQKPAAGASARAGGSTTVLRRWCRAGASCEVTLVAPQLLGPVIRVIDLAFMDDHHLTLGECLRLRALKRALWWC